MNNFLIFHFLLKFIERTSIKKISFKNQNLILWKKSIKDAIQIYEKNNILYKKFNQKLFLKKISFVFQTFYFYIDCDKSRKKNNEKFVKKFFQLFSYFVLKKTLGKKKRVPNFLCRTNLGNIFFESVIRSKLVKKDLVRYYSIEKNLKMKKKEQSKQYIDTNIIEKILEIKNTTKNKIDIVDPKIFYERFNNILFKNAIKGFTPDVFRQFISMINNYARKLVIDIRKSAIIRQKTERMKKKDWGIKKYYLFEKNISEIQKKIRDFEKSDRILQRQIYLFKRKKKNNKHHTKNENLISKQKSKKTKKKKLMKRKIIEENLFKTNKTLMTLLRGILQERIQVLKEATKCLCKYRPSPLEISLEKKKKTSHFRKEKAKIVSNKANVQNLSGFNNHVTYEDCLFYLKKNKEKIGNTVFAKWFFGIVLDHNLRVFENNI